MSKYWTYLTNNNGQLLTLECYTQTNIERMKLDYIDLVSSNFFNQFSDFDKLFISDKSPENEPQKNKLFEMKTFF